MTNLLGILNMGTSALLLQQRAINVTGNNIANVNTPGYARQRLNLKTNAAYESPVGLMGWGVGSAGVERIYDRFLGVQLNGENADLGRWEARKGILERVEVVFDESGGYGLNQALSEFWTAWQDLAMNPSGETERSVVAATGQALADTVRQKYADLQQIASDIDASVKAGVADINRLAVQIADLNAKIAETESRGVHANDYRDSRDLALKQLSELVQINSFEDAEGRAVVSVGSGRVLVESGNVWTLSTETDGNGHARVVWPDANGNGVDITAEISSGKLGGWLQTRDATIAGYLSRLDALVDPQQGLMFRVNTQHAAGYGLDSSTGTNLFTGSGAADMSLNPLVRDNLNLIAASSTLTGVPGNAENALAIHALSTTLTLDGNTATFDEAVNTLVSQVGYDVQETGAHASHQADMMAYLENYRESISGVSLDEEMVNLVKYQAAYNSAAKMISMADEMLDSLMNMIR